MELALTIAGIILIVAVGGAVVITGARHLLSFWRVRRAASRRQACVALLQNLAQMNESQVKNLALRIKSSAYLDLAEGVIVEMIKNAADTALRLKLADLYNALGLIERIVSDLRESKSWTARAQAAQNLGLIAHPSGVLPLIACLQDKTETPEVKNVALRSLAALRDTRAIEPLIEALRDADASAGQPITDALARLGLEAVPPLIAVLQNSQLEDQRYWTVKALSRLQAPQSGPALVEALKDRSEKVREAAAEALGELKLPIAVHPLKEALLGDPVPLVREKAAAALGKIGDEHAMEALKRGLADMEYSGRLKAMEALESMGAKSIPLFLAALFEANDARMAGQAAVALERMGIVEQTLEGFVCDSPEITSEQALRLLARLAQSGATQTLARVLREHSDWRRRVGAARVFREAKYPATHEVLVEAVYHDPEWNVRLESARALAAIKHAASLPAIAHVLKQKGEGRGILLVDLAQYPQNVLKEFIADISPLTKDLDYETRLAAVSLLGVVQHLKSVGPLIASLNDGRADIRCKAAEALAYQAERLIEGAWPDLRAAPEAADISQQSLRLKHEATQALLKILVQDTQLKARIAAAQALGFFRDPETIIPLAQSFITADESYRDDIVRALVQIDHEEILHRVNDLLALRHPKARAGVAWTLGMTGDFEELEHLNEFLNDEDAMVRAAAAGGMGCMALPEAAPILIERLGDPNERVRAAVVNALSKCGDSGAVDHLRRMLDDPDLFVAARAALAIGVLGSKSRDRQNPASLLKAWKEKITDPMCRAASLIALVLLEEDAVFKECLILLTQPGQRDLLKKQLASLSPAMQKKFFGLISFDPRLIFEESARLEDLAAHYAKALHSSRFGDQRVRAVEMLTLINLPDAPAHLERALTADPEPKVRRMAFEALSKILHGPELAKIVIAQLQDPDESIRHEAALKLKNLNPQELRNAKNLVIPLLDNKSPALRETVIGLLVRLYEKNAMELVPALEEAADKNRILGLLLALGALGDSAAVNVFLKWSQHADAEIRAAAIVGGAWRGLLSSDDLLPFLDDPQEAPRAAAMNALMDQWSPAHLPILLSRLQDPSIRVRQALAAILGRPAPPPEERPKEALRQLMKDYHVDVQAQALISLFRLGDESVAPEAVKIVSSMERSKKIALIAKLEAYGIVAHFVSMLKNNPSSAKRRQALEFLAALDLERFSGDLMQCLQDPSADVRVASITTLAALKDPAIRNSLENLSGDPAEAVRTAVQWSRLNLP
ncbi:MAG: HEAT repeat domain-containing protein [Elusimicrobia bacterium]|nr:HEAT repeat domain-containing protein [Elusimicrobiota bacterium]